MKKPLSLALAVLFAIFHAAPAFAGSVDGMINEGIRPVSDLAMRLIFVKASVMGRDVPLIIVWLMAIGVFTSFYFGFINLRLFGTAARLLRGSHHSEEGHGQISNWGALSTSLSGTVGLGNIAGVAVAVTVGGPGATVWMILMGFLGMSTKFVECALGVKYRVVDKDGEASGGPMYYIPRGFADRGWPKTGKALGAFFAVCCVGGAIGGGNMFQANQTYQMFLRAAGENNVFADQAWLFGLLLALLVGAVILGGIRAIADVSTKIFPVMAFLYLGACLAVILTNAAQFPEAVASIFSGAFTPESAAGGILGAMIAGVQRAVFSNEAGMGSAAITYAAVRSDAHVGQGLIAMFNPFIDTVIICTATALVISITGVYEAGQGMEGIALTARAFATMGEWAIYWLGITVFLFAYSTLISWYYLGEKAFTWLAGKGRGRVAAFKVFYCLCVIIGCAANLSHVIDLTDALFFSMAIPNVIALYVMAPEIRKDLKAYLKQIRAEKQAKSPSS